MKVLVTGGAGFIASNVVDRLVAEGYEVAVVDDLSTGFRENVNPKATFHQADLRDADAMARIFEAEKPDFVDHHAAQMDVRRSTKEPVFDAECNILGSLNLITESLKVGVKRIVYASTGGAVYGEPVYLPADENHPINPVCQYGISKHTVEHYLYLYHYNYGLDYTILRYPNVYGPRQNPHGEAGVVAIFTEKLLRNERPTIFGKGNQTRDYVFVGDVVEANLLALRGNHTGIFNLGTGVETSVQQIFDGLKAAVGANVEPIYAEERLGEIQRICLKADKAAEILGWRPTHTLAEGLEKTIAYYRQRLK